MRERFLKKAIGFIAACTLAVTGAFYTKNTDEVFKAKAAGGQAIKISCCYFLKQEGYYSYFFIQCAESTFPHKGVNKVWTTYATGIPQYKVDPYFNPWNWNAWSIYTLPKDQLGTYNTQYWQAGSITIK